ncbi:Uncharacterised protein [Aggregatibacter aphrophilus]|uniref:Uncharacterized protein n=3 Tax=Aggregatibacter aphrophilus TaxID=732 RepID=A0A336NBD1_AGGAP|nr:hypothetical protein [Aggregatibacter aphrophilus]SSZ30908.1 Uncharacterised protein [Aggregatibacter aphrophilus]VEF40666.1 Uncharacterised protein [Aggregatibacter aphrophilus ATCC 33389]
MSEQEKQTNEQNNKIESPIIPNVAYPLKPRSNTTNLSQQYFNRLAGDETSAFLFNDSGLWHQGIHLRASQFPSSEFENDKICAIADGKLIAYKVDSEYKKDSEVEVPMKSAVYSTGYFLLKHKMAYPKDNVLTFYSLYRHTAKLSDYPPKKRYVTKSADANPVTIKDRRGVVIAQLADGLIISIKSPNSKASRHEIESYQDEQGQIHRPSNGDIWTIYKGSYHQEEDSTQHAIPFLSQNNIETEADKEVLLSGNRQIEVKAGEVLGLMGEYNQTGKSGEKLLHLEVFTYDDIEQFRAKAEAAYKQDKEKKGIKDNFLYVARGSQLYTVLKDEVVELEKTQVEIMVPLADVAKQTVKKNTDKTGKDYYNVQPYLYSLLENNNDGGIYVDDSHLTHGLLFPGVNVFKDEAHEVSIFKEKIATCAEPEGTATPEEKDRLGPVFKEIWQELDVDKDSRQGEVQFEAGTLKALLTNPIIRRRLTGIIVRHKSEWSAEQEGKFEELKALMRKNNCAEKAERFGKRVADLGIKLKGEGFDSEQEAYYMHPLGLIGWLSGMCMPLKEAKETALIISGTYEGKGGFASLSGNFDNMGMSWGIVQFNFGQNTLGPLLIDMRNKNTTLFNGCFSNNEDLSSLNKALDKGTNEQMKWAIDMQNKYNSRWKDIFNKLAEIREFQEIQIEHADKYIKTAIHIIRWMRGIHPSVMEKVEFKTFAALVDLSIQQGGIDKVKDIIKAKSLSSPPNTQYAFAKLVVEERGSTASARWRADCISRRLGILNKKATSYSHSGYVAKRDNSKFSLIKEVYICEL